MVNESKIFKKMVNGLYIHNYMCVCIYMYKTTQENSLFAIYLEHNYVLS